MYQVLIADDELSVLKSLMDGIQWEELGLTVAAAVNNGEEALQILKTGEIDIAILDIRMPGLNGLEICEKLCREQENLQLILISGYAEFSYAERAIRYGVLGYCLKPIEFEQLTRFLLKAERNCEKQNAQLPDSDLLDVLERGDQETLEKTNEKFASLGLPVNPLYSLLQAAAAAKLNGKGATELYETTKTVATKMETKDLDMYLYYTIIGLKDLFNDTQKEDLLALMNSESTKGYVKRSIK